MATLREYFDREARHYLAQLGDAVNDAAGAFASGALHRAARGLRGTAQMARHDAVYRIALTLEQVSRPGTSRAAAPAELRARLEETLSDLRQLVDGRADEATATRIAEGAVGRWREVGVGAAPARAGARTSEPREEAAGRAFFGFAAREVGALAEALESSVAALIADPLDREAIKRVLRQQRALLGSARLDEVPVVAETLRAVEDLSRVVAKLDVPVKGEWLDVFRCARDVLHVAAPALAAREQPTPTNALSRLRTLREELVDRYGAGEAISVAPGEGLHQPTSVMEAPPAVELPAATEPAVPAAAGAGSAGAAAPAATPGGTRRPAADRVAPGAAPAAAVESDVVDIQVLCYRGSAALRRALELRARFEAAVAKDPAASEIVNEVFDLIRLGLDE